MSHILCIYAKPPVPGRTKSRLAEVIGDEAAANLAGAMLADLCREAAQLEEVEVQLWHPPDTSSDQFGEWVPDGITWHPQQGADLGQRMSHTFRSLTPEGEAQVLLVGSDCVTFTAALFELAFELLERVQVVVQPADDGGYVLVGQSCWCPEMFEQIEWGTERVLAATWNRLQATGCHHCELTPTRDIDLAEDLRQLPIAVEQHHRPALAAWLERYPLPPATG